MPKKPPEPSDPKTGVGPFRVWRNSVAGLSSIERMVRNQLKKMPEDERPPWLADLYLKVSDAADRKLMTELKARQIILELRDRDMQDWTPEQIEKVIEGHIRRRGYRNVDRIRKAVVRTLVEAGQPAESAQQFVDSTIPAVPESDERFSVQTQLNHSYQRIQADMDAGREELQAALEGPRSSEGDPYGDDGGGQGTEEGPSSDETVRDGEAVH